MVPRSGPHHGNRSEIDAAMTLWMNTMFFKGEMPWRGERLLAAITHFVLDASRAGALSLPRARGPHFLVPVEFGKLSPVASGRVSASSSEPAPGAQLLAFAETISKFRELVSLSFLRAVAGQVSKLPANV